MPPAPEDDLVADPLSGGDLAAFVAGVETGTARGAGEALDLTQSAATKRIQALEKRLGTTLFERGRFGLRPTAAGRLLYPEAKRALQALRAAEAIVSEQRRAAEATIRIAASLTIGGFLLPDWLLAFRRDHPEARTEVEIVNSHGVLQALRDGAAQLGFVEGLDDLDGFEARTVHRDAMTVVVAPGHPWAKRRRIRPAELAQDAYHTREALSGTRAVATAALAQFGVELVPTLATASTQAVKRAVLGGGFSILSELAVAVELEHGVLHAVEVDGLTIERELRVVRTGPLRGMARELWEWLADRA